MNGSHIPHFARSPAIYALAGMVAMAAIMGIGRFVYTPILPGMMDELGLSASDAGLIASANYAGYLLGAILAAGNWGQGREYGVVMGSIVTTAVLAIAMGMTESVPLFIAIRFMAGLASALAMVFLSTVILSRLALAGRADLQAWHFGGVGLGMALSALTIGALVLAGAGWNAGWLWSGALCAVAFIVVFLIVDRGPVAIQRPLSEPSLPKSPVLLRLIIAYGLFGFGYIITATFLVAIVRSGEAGRLFEAAVWLVAGLAGFPSVWLWNRFASKYGLAKAFAVGCVVEAVGVAASVSLGAYIGPLIGAALLGGTFIAITSIGLQFARQLAAQAPRRVFAIMTAAFGFGQIVGPLMAGWVADYSGSFAMPSFLAAGVLLVAAVIVLKRS